MPRTREELTEKGWELTDSLWEAGQATVTDLQRRLTDSQGRDYGMFKTILARLVGLGYVKASRVANAYKT